MDGSVVNRMIKAIKVRNFLSLREVDLKLRPRSVLVGPNMSGKSNLIECLKFLQEAVGGPAQGNSSPLQEAFNKRGGFAEVIWKGSSDGVISFVLTADFPESAGKGLASFRYETSFRRHEYGHPVVDVERLTVESKGKSETILENADGKLKFVGQGGNEGPQNTLGLSLEMCGRRGSSEMSEFWRFVTGWRFYNLVPALMRQSNSPSQVKYLSEHGENLSAWLFALQGYTDAFDRIRQVCRDVLPGVGEILFQPVEAPRTTPEGGTTIESAKISVGAKETHFKRPMSLARMSDGELAFLALVSIILAPEELSPPLLCLEEPENYLHPGLIEILVDLLDQRSMEPGAAQIIMTTHSPLLVDHLSLEELVVTEKAEGATRFTSPSSKKHLKTLLSHKEISLGDLWYSGALSDS